MLLLSRGSDSAAESLQALSPCMTRGSHGETRVMPSDTQYEPFYSDGYLVLAGTLLVDENRWPEFPINPAVQAVLFTALAAEAFINLALTIGLGEKVAKDVDRWSTLEKFVYGPWLMSGQKVLDESIEPFQGLKKTLKQRNVFAHAKAPKTVVKTEDGVLVDLSLPTLGFAEKEAARLLARTCQAIETVADADSLLEPHGLVAKRLLHAEAELLAWDENADKNELQLRTLLEQLHG